MSVTSIVITCKNRLHHLKQTLPSFVRQSACQVIVVDYGCAQGTAEWVLKNYPSVSVVKVTDDPVFCLSRARNCGVRAARGKFLLFADADIALTGDIGKWISENAGENYYYQEPEPRLKCMNGTVLCSKRDFELVDGYDEAFRGWGGEDIDLYHRLRSEGIEERYFDSKFLDAIEHEDSERQLSVESGGMGNMKYAFFANHLYMNVKADYQKLTGKKLEAKGRIDAMKIIKDAVEKIRASDKEESLTIEFRFRNTFFNGKSSESMFSKKIVYTLNGGGQPL